MGVPVLDERAIAEYRAAGLSVPGAFDPVPLSEEMDRLAGMSDARKLGSGGVEFRSAPMMCERTPAGPGLLDAVAPLVSAARWLRRAPRPRQGHASDSGSTDWHTDSEIDVVSIGVTVYVEPVHADTGALRVVPGSHRAARAENRGQGDRHRGRVT